MTEQGNEDPTLEPLQRLEGLLLDLLAKQHGVDVSAMRNLPPDASVSQVLRAQFEIDRQFKDVIGDLARAAAPFIGDGFPLEWFIKEVADAPESLPGDEISRAVLYAAYMVGGMSPEMRDHVGRGAMASARASGTPVLVGRPEAFFVMQFIQAAYILGYKQGMKVARELDNLNAVFGKEDKPK